MSVTCTLLNEPLIAKVLKFLICETVKRSLQFFDEKNQVPENG